MTGRILVVDDHALLAQSLTFALRARGFDARTATIAAAQDLLDQARSTLPDLVMLDMQLGGEIGSGVTLVAPLTELGTRVLVVSGVGDPLVVAAALEAGAVGYVAKTRPFDELVETASRAARGLEVLPPGTRSALLAELRRHRAESEAARRPFARLTPQESKVLRALCRGTSVTVMASEWFVSVPTVRTQVRAILHKLEVGSQLEAVTLAHSSGWAAEGQEPRHE